MEDLTRTLLIVMSGIVALIVIVFGVGMALDMFTFEFMSLGSDINPQFSVVSDSIQNLNAMFYFLPVIAVVLFGVYLFKWIIRKHRYTYEEEEYEEL